MTDTTIVIPQYNRAELTCNCIRTLRRCEPTTWPVIVVDDGSREPAAEAVAAQCFSQVKIVRQTHRGVSAAWNRGAAEAESEYLLFLNNDVCFRGAAVDQLIEPLRKKAALMTGAACRKETALPTAVLNTLPTRRFLQGWCFAVSAAVFAELDGFDESMLVYWSDTDYQLRLLQRFGRHPNPIVCVSSLPLEHLGHRTTELSPECREIWRKDRVAFLAKWGQVPVGENRNGNAAADW